MFKVPEKFRIPATYGRPLYSPPNSDHGHFSIPHRHDKKLTIRCTASAGIDAVPWEHVSITIRQTKNDFALSRCPTWDEMCYIKDMFWDKTDTVIQFHPPEDQYVSTHNYCLHLWRPKNVNCNMPPLEAVGFKTGQIL